MRQWAHNRIFKSHLRNTFRIGTYSNTPSHTCCFLLFSPCLCILLPKRVVPIGEQRSSSGFASATFVRIAYCGRHQKLLQQSLFASSRQISADTISPPPQLHLPLLFYFGSFSHASRLCQSTVKWNCACGRLSTPLAPFWNCTWRSAYVTDRRYFHRLCRAEVHEKYIKCILTFVIACIKWRAHCASKTLTWQ